MVQKIMAVILFVLASTSQNLNAKQKENIEIKQEFIIQASIEKAWEILGPGFENAYKWAASVNHSVARDSISFNGSACTERGCDVSGIGSIKEKLLIYSEIDHKVSYQIYEGMPKMVKYACNTWQLFENGMNSCKLIMKAEFKVGGMMGTMMGGMMKKKMTKLTNEIGEEFVYYVERNEPHPRKVEAQKKFEKKSN